jgi:hypothetical protein
MGNQYAQAVRAACAVERTVTDDEWLGGTMVLLDNIVEIPAAAHFDEPPLRMLWPLETEHTLTGNQPGNPRGANLRSSASSMQIAQRLTQFGASFAWRSILALLYL